MTKHIPNDRAVDMAIALLDAVVTGFHGQRSPISAHAARVLTTLAESRSRTQAELVEALGIDRRALSKVLNRLERRRLVARTRDVEDGRRLLVELLPAGAQAARTPVRFDRDGVRSALLELDGMQRYR